MIHQLRTYRIFHETRDAFHQRFEQHAWRIMKTYGFEILAFWDATEPSASADADEAAQPVFMYLLQWPDEQTMKSAWEGFMADQEWKDIKTATAAEHGKFVDSITDQLLTQTDYSPGLLPK